MRPKGDRVILNLDPTGVAFAWSEESYEIIDLLSSQFTVDVDGSTVFLFYSEEEILWKNT